MPATLSASKRVEMTLGYIAGRLSSVHKEGYPEATAHAIVKELEAIRKTLSRRGSLCVNCNKLSDNGPGSLCAACVRLG